jgi:hypothetical protein
VFRAVIIPVCIAAQRSSPAVPDRLIRDRTELCIRPVALRSLRGPRSLDSVSGLLLQSDPAADPDDLRSLDSVSGLLLQSDPAASTMGPDRQGWSISLVDPQDATVSRGYAPHGIPRTPQ